MKEYKCLHCGDHTIYLSRWGNDHRGTLTCFKCGETEDSRSGISKNGVQIETFRNYKSQLFTDMDVDLEKDLLQTRNRNDSKRRGPFLNEKPRRNENPRKNVNY